MVNNDIGHDLTEGGPKKNRRVLISGGAMLATSLLLSSSHTRDNEIELVWYKRGIDLPEGGVMKEKGTQLQGRMSLPEKPKKVIPAGCKVWTEYGNVMALNEKSAIKKFNNQSQLNTNP